MLRSLLATFRKESLLDKAFKDSYAMLALTEKMYIEAQCTLRKQKPGKVGIDVYDSDKKVNKFERKVRKKVHQHLTEAGRGELYSGLLLVSVIIDIERIGDECKNVLDLATHYHTKLKCKPYEKDLRKIEAAVEDTFSRVRKQFENFEKTDAEKLLSEYRWVNQLCDQREGDLIKQTDKSIPSAHAVAMALYIRHLKRINSHLRNISTCVVNPFDKIRFVPKPKLQ